MARDLPIIVRQADIALKAEGGLSGKVNLTCLDFKFSQNFCISSVCYVSAISRGALGFSWWFHCANLAVWNSFGLDIFLTLDSPSFMSVWHLTCLFCNLCLFNMSKLRDVRKEDTWSAGHKATCQKTHCRALKTRCKGRRVLPLSEKPHVGVRSALPLQSPVKAIRLGERSIWCQRNWNWLGFFLCSICKMRGLWWICAAHFGCDSVLASISASQSPQSRKAANCCTSTWSWTTALASALRCFRRKGQKLRDGVQWSEFCSVEGFNILALFVWVLPFGTCSIIHLGMELRLVLWCFGHSIMDVCGEGCLVLHRCLSFCVLPLYLYPVPDAERRPSGPSLFTWQCL